MADIHGLRLNLAGGRALLNSAEVAADLMRRAEAIASAAESAGDGEYAANLGRTDRARASVVTADAVATSHNAKHNTLLGSLDAGRR